MTTRDIAPAGAPCWVDLFTSDPGASRAFYGELFGWTSKETGPEYGGYVNFLRDGLPTAGCMAKQPGQEGVPDVWTIYLATDDAAGVVSAAEARGSQVICPAMAVGDLGTMAVVTDAGGAVVGAWQPGLHKGFTVLGEPGTPTWCELHTRDYDASIDFYREVFGWDPHTAPVPGIRYTTHGPAEAPLAGLMDASGFLPEGVPSNWAVYFGVEDTDAALARAVALGGKVVQPAEDTPYGRLAQAADSTGALFKLISV